MSRMLGIHTDVYAFPHEIHFFEEKWDPQEGLKNVPIERAIELFSWLMCVATEGYLIHGNPEKYRQEATVALQDTALPLTMPDIYSQFLHYTSQKKGKLIICEQTPRYLYFVDDILRIFPEAYIVNMIRDPRDTLLSQKNKWRMRYLGAKKTIPLIESFRSYLNYHPYTMSLFWRKGIRAALQYQGCPRFISVRYEDVVSTPQKTIENLCNKIGIVFKEQMLKIPVEGSSTSVANKERKEVANFVGKWKGGGLDNTEIFISEKIAGSFLDKFGYEKLGIQPNPFMIFWWVLLFPIKMSLALLLSLGRISNIYSSIARRL